MNKKIKIKISENAFEKLLTMLKTEHEYSYLRFAYKGGCCKSSKVDILLDNHKANDIIDNVESLPIAYDLEALEKIKEITLVYRNSSFMVNAILRDTHNKNCATCNSTCHKKFGS